MSNQLFITVKYGVNETVMEKEINIENNGKNKDEIFNPHCKCLLLVECIREKCQCGEEVTLDLIDETGTLSNISEKINLAEYANQFLEGRRKYILVKVTKTSNPEVEPHKYESLLVNIEKHYPDLAERLERLSKPSQHTAKGKSWHGTKKRYAGMLKAKSAKRNSVAK